MAPRMMKKYARGLDVDGAGASGDGGIGNDRGDEGAGVPEMEGGDSCMSGCAIPPRPLLEVLRMFLGEVSLRVDCMEVCQCGAH